MVEFDPPTVRSSVVAAIDALASTRPTSGGSGLVPPVRAPDVVIVGAQKAATTGLLRSLAQHPRVSVPRASEATVLHGDSIPWPDWVRQQEQQLTQVDEEGLLVVKLASAMYFPATVENIARLNPATRLVVSLRHPVDRILSQYMYAVQHGLESRPVEEALTEDVVQRSGSYRLRTYSEGSRYAKAVAAIRDHFDDDQVLYVDFATVHTPVGILAVERFLDLDDVAVPSLRVNVSHVPRSMALARVTRSSALRTVARRSVPARWRRRVRDLVQQWNASSKAPAKPAIAPGLRRQLLERHAVDTDAAEQVLNMDLSDWRR